MITNKHVLSLVEALEEIGWKREHRGCKHYGLISPSSHRTEAWFMGDQDRLTISDEVFGKHEGTLYIDLSKCTIEKKPGMVSIFLKLQKGLKQKNYFFMSFYNHDIKEIPV